MELNFDDCVIRHDGRQYILSSKRIAKNGKHKGDEVEDVIGYYPLESQVLTGLIRHGMSDDSINSIEQIKEMIGAAANRLNMEKAA